MSNLVASQLLIFVWFLALWNLKPSFYQRKKCLKLELALNRCFAISSTICRQERNLNVEGSYIHQIAGIQLNRWMFTPASHHPLSRSFPSEVFLSIFPYPQDSHLSSTLNSTAIPLFLCLLGIAVPGCVTVLHFIHRSVCTKSLNYGTLNETVCRAWAKLGYF